MTESKDQCDDNACPVHPNIQKADLARHRRRQISKEQRSVGNLLGGTDNNSLKGEPADDILSRQRIAEMRSAPRD